MNNYTDYRERFYKTYISSFKKEASSTSNYSFSGSKILQILAPWVSELDRRLPCIDLGCGNGNLLGALRKLGFLNLLGVDASEEQVAIAQVEFPNVTLGFARDCLLSAPQDHFGLITLFDVIEHLTKPELLELFDLCASRLKKNGVLIVHCPNGSSPFVGSVRYGDFTHETVLTPVSAANVCAVAGLTSYEAREHLGASETVFGAIRRVAWGIIRLAFVFYDLVEIGGSSNRIYTRNFAFKAVKETFAET